MEGGCQEVGMLHQRLILILVVLTCQRMADMNIPNDRSGWTRPMMPDVNITSDVNITYDREWLQSISDKLTMVCPLDNVCHTLTGDELDRKYDNYTSTGMRPCCRGCSCADNCGEWDNCCFLSEDNPGIYNRSNEECIHTEVIKPSLRAVTNNYYYVVVSCDQNMYIGTKHIETEYPWGDFYPVFSKKTHKIYKNEYIALCNGVTDGKHWDAVLICDDDASIMLTTTGFQQIMSGRSCAMFFKYTQGTLADIRREECVAALHDNCVDGFTIPEGLEMSKSEIISACKSDFVSPYILKEGSIPTSPKNIFCAICSKEFLMHFDPECSTKDSLNAPEGSAKSPFSDFGMLLSPDFLSLVKEENDQSTRMACRPSYNRTSDSSECRPVLCPTGQYERTDGTCAFVSDDIFVRSAVLFLRLTPVDPVDIEHLKLTPVAFTNLSVVDEPWTRISWTVSFVYCRHIAINSSTCFLDGFIVVVDRKSIAMKSEGYYSQVKAALGEKMTWKIGSVTMVFNQDIQRHSKIMVESYITGLYKVRTDDIVLEHRWTHSEQELGLLEEIRLTSQQYGSHIERITKLNFCSRVTLFPEDYDYLVDLTNDILLYKHTNRILYDSEMAKTSRTDPYPKVCLSDTDFTEVTSPAMTLHFFNSSPTMYMYLCISLWQFGM